MAPRIIFVPPSPEIGEIAREMAPAGFDLMLARSDSPEFTAALGEAQYMVCYPNVEMKDPFYRAAPRLKLVQLLSAGYDNVDLEAACRAKVPVANNGGANAVAVAEHTCLGTIGKKVARLARAFGMRVEYYDIVRLSEDAEDALGVRFRLLRELLKNADIVSLHVPLNHSTRGMIGAGELALLAETAILINTCRGPVVDETALARMLGAGRLLGAGLDVFDREPPGADNPLLRLDNVVLTAHFAGPTWDNHVARFRNAFDNVERVERGEAPLWVVPEPMSGDDAT